MSLQIRKLSHAIGAEISGIDIQKPLDEKTRDAVRAAFLDHCVLLFRGQPLTREQHIAFSREFGEVDKNEVVKPGDSAPTHSEIAFVINKNFGKPDANTSSAFYTGRVWHTDRSFLPAPSAATMLRALELPDVGGDTMFTNCYLAYETLSDGMKKLLEGMNAAHMRADRYLDFSTPEKLEESKRRTRTAQPLVRVHPETGRKSLFLGETLIKYIVGMTPEESAPILQFLHKHASRPQFVYRHSWQVNDVVIWDNRCTMHIALGDYDKEHQMRRMEKTYLVGTPSGFSHIGQ